MVVQMVGLKDAQLAESRVVLMDVSSGCQWVAKREDTKVALWVVKRETKLAGLLVFSKVSMLVAELVVDWDAPVVVWRVDKREHSQAVVSVAQKDA